MYLTVLGRGYIYSVQRPFTSFETLLANGALISDCITDMGLQGKDALVSEKGRDREQCTAKCREAQ